MTDAQIWAAILIAAGVSLLVRALPLTLIRRPIQNRFIRSFLAYIPYAVLGVMTFPAMIDAAVTPGAGIAALAAGVIAAGAGAGLFPVAVLCCAVEYVAGLL